MYSLIKKFLFLLPPETSHVFSLQALKWFYRTGFMRHIFSIKPDPQTIMGLTFPHRIGLAAGLDKNGDYIDALAALGFAFIEIGTITPRPQKGHPRPRLFRLIPEEAIINRMGFNNKGMMYVVEQLKKIRYRGILGINIGKNQSTPNEKAIDDYLMCFQQLWPYASYITINVSSPNTTGLRDLQQSHLLRELLRTLKQEQYIVYQAHQKYVPLVVKISPDLSSSALNDLAEILLEEKIDGVIATNTTIERNTIAASRYAHETGGLSGAPLNPRSTAIIQTLYAKLQNQIPIMASGGVMQAADVKEKYQAGAQLIQLYTGFIYKGPRLIREGV
jgi:dihydroorotate dehydrogenase